MDRVEMVEALNQVADTIALRLGVVEVDLFVGEEPEEGVEFEVVACADCVWGEFWDPRHSHPTDCA